MYVFGVSQVAEELAQAEGISKLLVAQHEGYKGFLPGMCVPHKPFL